MILNLFLKRFNSLYKSFLCKSVFNFKHKFIDDILMLSLTFPVTCRVCTKNPKVTSWFVYNSKCLLCGLLLYLQWQLTILKLAFLFIIGSLGSLYETTVLFHWKQQFLIIISTFKPLALYFPILKQVLKSELLNYLKNSRNSLICFIAMPIYMLSKEFQNQFHCVCVAGRSGFPTNRNNSGTSTGSPTIQLNFDTTDLNIESDSTVKSSVLQDYPLPPTHTAHTHIKCQLQVKVVTCASDWQAIE